MEPTQTGFVQFVREVMGITPIILPDDSSVFGWTYNYAIQTVNLALDYTCFPVADPSQPSLYALAVYNLAGHTLLCFAQDPEGAPIYKDDMKYFAYIRKTFNLSGFTSGVIQSTNDLTTGGSYVVPEAFKNLTIGDLNLLKTPYGQFYLTIAQDYGPSEWGIS